jgi:hypothetical protein
MKIKKDLFQKHLKQKINMNTNDKQTNLPDPTTACSEEVQAIIELGAESSATETIVSINIIKNNYINKTLK